MYLMLFFLNDPATTKIYTLSLPDALPIYFQRQQFFQKKSDSLELTAKTIEGRQTDRRQLQWAQRVGTPKGPFQARHEFFCRVRSEEHTSELQSQSNLVCRLLLENDNQ